MKNKENYYFKNKKKNSLKSRIVKEMIEECSEKYFSIKDITSEMRKRGIKSAPISKLRSFLFDYGITVSERQSKIIGLIQAFELSYKETMEIVDSQFDFVKYTMTQGHFEGVRLPYLGKFYAPVEKIRKLNYHAAIQRRRTQDNSKS